MSRSEEIRPRYSVRYEWQKCRPPAAIEARILLADSLDDAKLEAAILYACLDTDVLPSGYRIVKGAKRVVYRFPESVAEDLRSALAARPPTGRFLTGLATKAGHLR